MTTRFKESDSGEACRTSPKGIEGLLALDWSFAQRPAVSKLESIHPYPAKFIGDIPAAFLNELDVPPGTAVLDPFCGSGTTLVEAQKRGLPAIGVDLNPIACLISRVKTSSIAPNFMHAVANVVRDSKAQSNVVVPPIPRIDHWFKPEIKLAVSALSATIGLAKYSQWLDPLRLALSSILVRVSNQESDTRYAAIDKPVRSEDVYQGFVRAANRLLGSLSERDWPLTLARVIEADILSVTPDQIEIPIGLVVTSPPYPNAYEYWLYHKYRMWWLGFDPISVKQSEIGARAHFFKKNAHTALHFSDQMRKTLTLMHDVLVPNGYACILVGRSKIHGEVVDNGSMLYELAPELGLEPVCKFDRPIFEQRKSFNLSHANIKKETVIVLRKNL